MESTYTEAIGDIICEGIAQGRSLRSICAEPGMPHASTVCKWVGLFPLFATQYIRAREAQAETLAEETLAIADDGSNDWMQKNDPKNPGYEFNGEHVQRSRLRVDARKWFASKVYPKRYGEKLELAADPERPLIPIINVTIGERS